jgi:hypothetical protein
MKRAMLAPKSLIHCTNRRKEGERIPAASPASLLTALETISEMNRPLECLRRRQNAVRP